MTQGSYLAATAGAASITNIELLNMIAWASLINYQIIGRRNTTPLLDYSKIIPINGSPSVGSTNIFQSSVIQPSSTRLIDPRELKHLPTPLAEQTRSSNLSRFGDAKINTEAAMSVQPYNFGTAFIARYIDALKEGVITAFIRDVEMVFKNAFDGTVTVRGSNVGTSSDLGGTKLLTAEEDDIPTIDATGTGGLTSKVIGKVKVALANRDNLNTEDILLVIPYEGQNDYINDTTDKHVITENTLFNTMSVSKIGGMSFYTPNTQHGFYEVQNGIVDIDGNTLNDVVLGYAVPRNSIAFGYVEHSIPPVGGILNTLGIDGIKSSNNEIISADSLSRNVYSGNMMSHTDATTMFQMTIEKNNFPYLHGINTRVEYTLGAFRTRPGAIARIAFPKSYVPTAI